MFCPRCGEQLPDDATVRFCPRCGNSTGEGNVSMPPCDPVRKKRETAKKRLRARVVVPVLLGALLLGSGVGAATAFMQTGMPAEGVPKPVVSVPAATPHESPTSLADVRSWAALSFPDAASTLLDRYGDVVFAGQRSIHYSTDSYYPQNETGESLLYCTRDCLEWLDNGYQHFGYGGDSSGWTDSSSPSVGKELGWLQYARSVPCEAFTNGREAAEEAHAVFASEFDVQDPFLAVYSETQDSSSEDSSGTALSGYQSYAWIDDGGRTYLCIASCTCLGDRLSCSINLYPVESYALALGWDDVTEEKVIEQCKAEMEARESVVFYEIV